MAHSVPVLSLDKAYDMAGVERWMEKARATDPETAFVVEEKIDGSSILLHYRDGVLERAVPRGNGKCRPTRVGAVLRHQLHDGALRQVAHAIPAERVGADDRLHALEAVGIRGIHIRREHLRGGQLDPGHFVLHAAIERHLSGAAPELAQLHSDLRYLR